jgi:MFS superfamily sulfate permease-like transporter
MVAIMSWRARLRAMWRCDWTDSVMHCVMVLITFTVLFLASIFLGTMMAMALATAWATLLREVTQRQSKRFNDDFRRGWDMWNWSPAKQFETIVPVLLAFSIGLIM